MKIFKVSVGNILVWFYQEENTPDSGGVLFHFSAVLWVTQGLVQGKLQADSTGDKNKQSKFSYFAGMQMCKFTSWNVASLNGWKKLLLILL